MGTNCKVLLRFFASQIFFSGRMKHPGKDGLIRVHLSWAFLGFANSKILADGRLYFPAQLLFTLHQDRVRPISHTFKHDTHTHTHSNDCSPRLTPVLLLAGAQRCYCDTDADKWSGGKFIYVCFDWGSVYSVFITHCPSQTAPKTKQIYVSLSLTLGINGLSLHSGFSLDKKGIKLMARKKVKTVILW